MRGDQAIDGALDIAVAGCGTAGMAAALLLARDGHRVTLFERFEKPGPIGSGLMIQPTGLAVLRELGLSQSTLEYGQRIDRLHGVAGGRVVLDVRYEFLGRHDFFGVGVHRAALFQLLFAAVQAEQVALSTGRVITGANTDAAGAWLLFAGSREGPFDLIVDALGTRSVLGPTQGRQLAYGALWANVDGPGPGFDAQALSQRYHRASVMAGALPIGTRPDGHAPQVALFWSLRADAYRQWRDDGLDIWKDRVRELWPATAPLLDQVRSADELTFARYAHKTLSRPVSRRLIHIGDSWHSTSPQLGQGANMALLDAFALALALRQERTLEEGLERAVVMRRRHVRLYQLLSAMLTPVYQSDSRAIPLIRDRLMGPMSKVWPFTLFQAALVSGLVGSPLQRLGIEAGTDEPSAVTFADRRLAR